MRVKGFLKRVSRADGTAVSLDALKQQLRVDDTDDDDLIAGYLEAAVDLVEKETSRILIPTTFEWRLDAWPTCGGGTVDLPTGPIREVLSIEYVDENGEDQALAVDQWDWEPDDKGGVLIFPENFTPPPLGRIMGAVRIGFEAGHDQTGMTGTGDDFSLRQPPVAAQCLRLIVAHWYQSRETAVDKALAEIPLGAQRLIPRLRIYR